MKKWFITVAGAAIVALGSSLLGVPTANAATNVVPDAALRACLSIKIMQAGLTQQQAGIITAADLAALGAKVPTIYCDSQGITSISGLEYLPANGSLRELSLSWNNISSIAPLAGLKSLTFLALSGNSISQLSPLSQLTNLKTLHLDNNQIKDVSALGNLTQLIDLWLSTNQISDVTPLGKLTNLLRLSLQANQISNVSPLGRLPNLKTLGLSLNKISDVSGLATLRSIMVLDLNSNQITDVAPLAALTTLKALDLDSNHISDLSWLSGLMVHLGTGPYDGTSSQYPDVILASGLTATLQTVTLPARPLGTYLMPAKSVSTDPIGWLQLDASSPTKAMTADVAAGKVTFSAEGTYVINWWSNSQQFQGTLTLTIGVPASARIPMYRIYSTSTGEHFYTSSPNEARVNVASGAWKYEGVGWYAPPAGDPVYRLAAIPGSGSAGHLFTTSVTERDAALASKNPAGQPYWKCETGANMPLCVGWYSGSTVPLLRAFNPMPGPGQGQHNYTTDANEQRVITGTGPLGGWKDEGVGWYAMQTGDPAIQLPV